MTVSGRERERGIIVAIGKAENKKIIGKHVNGADAEARVAAYREEFLYGIGAL